jgi:putative oxidoreductase
MKIASLIARILLGLVFVVFGLNGFLHFIPGQFPPGLAGDFLRAMLQSHYVLFVSAVELVSGVLLLANRYVILGLVLIGPVIVNILLFHIFLLPSGIFIAIFVAILWGIVALHHRQHLAVLFTQRA